MTEDVGRPEEPEARGLRVNARVLIPARELVVRATRGGGPGGQHVNTSSTRVELTWNLRLSLALESADRARLTEVLATRLDRGGWIRVVASDTRSQRQNRALAVERLGALLRKALVVRRPRKRTKPHRGAVEARLSEKKEHSERKRERRAPTDD